MVIIKRCFLLSVILLLVVLFCLLLELFVLCFLLDFSGYYVGHDSFLSLFYFSDELYSFLCCHSFPCRQSVPLSIFCSVIFMVGCRLCLYWFWNVHSSPLVLKNEFASYSTLGWQAFTMPWVPAFRVADALRYCCHICLCRDISGFLFQLVILFPCFV